MRILGRQQKKTRKVARTFAIYCDDKMVGFTMFAFDEEYWDPNDRYWLWRFMIDENLQGKGYGTAALQVIIQYFKEHGANNVRLSTKRNKCNRIIYVSQGWICDTGEMNDEEIVLELCL